LSQQHLAAEPGRECCSTAPSSDRADMLAKLVGLHRKP
jgi:hypothetical protein